MDERFLWMASSEGPVRWPREFHPFKIRIGLVGVPSVIVTNAFWMMKHSWSDRLEGSLCFLVQLFTNALLSLFKHRVSCYPRTGDTTHLIWILIACYVKQMTVLPYLCSRGMFCFLFEWSPKKGIRSLNHTEDGSHIEKHISCHC
jgi:hypothetical protein